MSVFQIATILITLSALFSYLNFQYIRMPTKIGVMGIALVISAALLASGLLGVDGARQQAATILRGVNFNELLLHGMLAFLLFAGAQSLNLNDLRNEKTPVVLLATVSVVVSTLVVGMATYAALHLMGINATIFNTLLFGALVSPTDPIAVIGIMKTARAPKSLEVQIAGESLFNDGIGVVVFLVIQELARGEASLSAFHIAAIFSQEALGGVLFGLSTGYVVYLMLKRIDNYQVEILLTLALAMGTYALAETLPIPISAPLAVVAAGLLIGNHGHAFAMSPETREHLDNFWEMLDETLNVVLFVLIGLEVLVIPLRWSYAFAGLVAIAITLLARWISVASVVSLLRLRRAMPPGTIVILTWGGLRGGISVALALSLSTGIDGSVIVAMTYATVIFSIIVQGLTVRRVTAHFVRARTDGVQKV